MVPRKRNSSKRYLDSFSVRGPETFNSLPKELRPLKDGMETFKTKLDIFLNMIPDIPRICAGSAYQSNMLDIQIRD